MYLKNDYFNLISNDKNENNKEFMEINCGNLSMGYSIVTKIMI